MIPYRESLTPLFFLPKPMPPTLAQLDAFVSSAHYDAETAGRIASLIPALKAAGQPGELISPGVRRIRGNLCNVHGKYGPCDKALSGKKKPGKGRARKPAKTPKTPEQRAQERQAQRQTNIADVAKRMADTDTGLSPSGSKALTAFAEGKAPTEQEGAGLAQMGLAERASDGSYRMTPTGRAVVSAMAAGDYQRAVDGISRATDQQGKRTERTTAAQTRQEAARQRRQAADAKRQEAQAKREAAQKKPAKAGAGGGKKPSDQADEKPLKVKPGKRAARSSAPSVGGVAGAAGNKKPIAQPAPEKAPAKQVAPELAEAATALSQGDDVTDEQLQGLIRNGLVKLNKDGEPVLTAAGQRATMKEVREIDTWQLETWQYRKPALPLGDDPTQLATWAWRAATSDGVAFKVFKDARGAYRWMAISSCAFEDRDREVVSTKALQEDCDHADSTGEYGPLRWWHMPGVDIGDCDFNAMHDRMLIEMGTFRNPAIAAAVHKAAADLELSIGFLHLPTEPDADRVFHHIRRYERSLVPRGKASNRFTQLMVKEIPMLDTKEKEAIEKLGSSPEALAYMQEVLATASTRQKAAESEGIRHKAEDSEALYFDSQNQPGIIREGQWVALKAFPAKAEAVEDATEAVVETDAVEEMVEEVTEDDPNELTLSAGDLAAISETINAAVAQIMGGLDLEKKVAGHVQGFLAPMQQAQTTKDAALAEQAERITQLQTQMAELTGDAPAAPYRASTAKDTTVRADADLLAAVKQQGNSPYGEFDDIIKGLGLARQ